MSDNRYHFITHWRVEGTVEDVIDSPIEGQDGNKEFLVAARKDG